MGALTGFEVGVLWGMWFVDVDALFGADGCAGWGGTAEDVTEVAYADSEAGFGAGLRNEQVVRELSGWQPEADCGFGMWAVGAVVVSGCVG